MENSGYGPQHLPSPALVVFSQAAGSLGEALRIQRPFHSQISDAKDLHHLSLVGSYGAHLLHGFPPHLLHPLPPAVTSSGSTPFSGGGAFVKPFPSNFSLPSAFAPPKCLGMDQKYGFQGMMFGGGRGDGRDGNVINSGQNVNIGVGGGGNVNNQNGGGGGGGGTSSESFRTDSSSPACASLSPPVKEESLEGHTSEEGDRDRICSPHDRSPPETPGFRPAPKSTSSSSSNQGGEPLNLRMENNGFYPFYRTSLTNSFAKRYLHQQGVGGLKKPLHGTSPSSNVCPVCGIQLSTPELETHFLSELDRLYKLSTGNERQKIKASLGMTQSMHQPPELQGTDSRWETFNRIRSNRQNRLRAKTRKRRSDSENEYMDISGMTPVCQNCPVCHGRLQRTPEEIGQHIEECLRKSRQIINEEDETVDVESYGDESSNSAMNMSQQTNLNINNNNINNNNNNVMKLEPPPNTILHQPHREENNITSMSGNGGGSGNGGNIGLHTPWGDRNDRKPVRVSCPPTSIPTPTISRATPTSTNQRIDLDYDQDQDHDMENDEEVIVDNTDDEEISSKRIRISEKDENKNNTEEATSSVEIDSATDPNNTKPSLMTPDSYVSTSETSDPSSKAQVLEELRARIRELEESPLKTAARQQSQDEANYKCYICKEPFKAPVISTLCWHVHCNDCWITISDTKKSCPQCKLITTINDLKKIQV